MFCTFILVETTW